MNKQSAYFLMIFLFSAAGASMIYKNQQLAKRNNIENNRIIDSLTLVVKGLDIKQVTNMESSKASLKMAFLHGYVKGGQMVGDNPFISNKQIAEIQKKDCADFNKLVETTFK